MMDQKEEKIMYVAVGRKLKKNKSTLTWALQNSGGKKICIIHVHQLENKIPTPIGYYLPAEKVDEAQLKAYREREKKEMSTMLDEYLHISERGGVSMEKLHIEHDCIEKGIIQLIEEHNIENLVMGAAADKHYHPRKLTDLRSKKAIYVREHASPSCHIWFVCSGYLIHTRLARKRIIKVESSDFISVDNNGAANNGGESAPNGPGWIESRWSMDVNGSNPISRSSSARESFEVLKMESGRESITSSSTSHSQMFTPLHSFAARIDLVEKWQSQGTGIESLYMEECRRRKDIEAELKKVKEELDRMKNNISESPGKVNTELVYMKDQVARLSKVKAELEYMKNDVLGELSCALEQKALLENQTGNSNFLLQVLGEKLETAIELVHKYGEQ